MRVVLWSTNYYPYIGGIERLVHNLACELMRQGHSVLVITDAPQKGIESKDQVDGVEIIRLPFSHALFTKQLPLIKKAIQSATDALIRFKADLVNVHGWLESMAFYQFRVAENLSIPFFLTIHGLLEQSHYKTLACHRLWSMCSAVSVVSRSIEDALRLGNFSHADIRLIYNGSQISSVKSKIPTKSPINLVCIGRLSPEKGFDTALYALALLQHRYPNLTLTIVGGGPLYTKLLELTKALGLQYRVQLLDYVPPHKIDEIIDQSSIVLMPSTYESFGLVAVEAALRCRPVIASDVGGLKEIVVHDETGMLVMPNNPSDLAKAIAQFSDKPHLISEMGLKGYQRAIDFFTLKVMAKGYIAMYKGE